MDDLSIPWKAFFVVLGLLMTLLAWISRGMHRDVSDLKDGRKQCEIDLERFKTHVSENYAKEANVQSSLSRIHERIDKLPSEIVGLIRKER